MKPSTHWQVGILSLSLALAASARASSPGSTLAAGELAECDETGDGKEFLVGASQGPFHMVLKAASEGRRQAQRAPGSDPNGPKTPIRVQLFEGPVQMTLELPYDSKPKVLRPEPAVFDTVYSLPMSGMPGRGPASYPPCASDMFTMERPFGELKSPQFLTFHAGSSSFGDFDPGILSANPFPADKELRFTTFIQVPDRGMGSTRTAHMECRFSRTALRDALGCEMTDATIQKSMHVGAPGSDKTIPAGNEPDPTGKKVRAAGKSPF